jgi:hypothetical protein
MLESDLTIGLNATCLMAGEQAEAGTIDTEKNNGISEVDQDIPQKLHR